MAKRTSDPVLDALHARDAVDDDATRQANSLDAISNLFGPPRTDDDRDTGEEEEAEETEEETRDEEEETEDEEVESDDEADDDDEDDEQEEEETEEDDEEEDDEEEESSPAKSVKDILAELSQKKLTRQLYKQDQQSRPPAQPAAPQIPQPQPQPPTAPQQQAPQTPEIAPFDVSIPPQMMEAITSEDPIQMQKGFEALVNAAGNLFMKTAMEQLMAQIPQIVTQQVLPQFMAQQVQRQQHNKRIVDEFYNEYPAWNTDDYRPVIAAVAEEVAEETGRSDWSPAFKAEIVRRAKDYLGFDGKAAPAKPQRNRRPQQQKKGARRRNKSGRRPSRSVGSGKARQREAGPVKLNSPEHITRELEAMFKPR